MNARVLKAYMELKEWRDEELKKGNMQKARKIHNIIIEKKICSSYNIYGIKNDMGRM